MLNFSVAGTVPVATNLAQFRFTLPGATKFFLTRMQVHTDILIAGNTPDRASHNSWCQLRSNLALAAVPFGEIVTGVVPVAPTVMNVNMGWPFCTENQEFVGCWPVKTEQLEIAITIQNVLNISTGTVAYLGNVSWWVRMTFEYANANE
jgi:hypothetical protein